MLIIGMRYFVTLFLTLFLLIAFRAPASQDAECNIVYGLRLEPYKPYEWIDEDGIALGINIDLLKALSKLTGCSYEIISETRQEMLAKLESGGISLMSIAPDDNADRFAAYISHFTVIYRYAVNRNADSPVRYLEDLRNKTILVLKGSYTDNYLTGRTGDYGLNILRYDTHTEMAEDLRNGTGDMLIASLPSIMNLSEMSDLRINDLPLMPSVYGFAVNKSETELYAKLEHAMNKLKESGEYFDIMRKWYHQSVPFIWYYVIYPLAGLGAVIVIILLWNKSLQIKVKKKTASLNNLTNLLQMLLDILPERIYLIGSDCKPVWSNLNAGKPSSFSLALIGEEIEKAVNTGISFETNLLLDNAETWSISGTVTDTKENPLLIVAADISAGVKRRDEMLNADRLAALGSMAATIAHEINNPAALIIHNISFISGLQRDINAFIDENGSGESFAGLKWESAKTELLSAQNIVSESITRIKNTVAELKEFGKKREGIYEILDLRLCFEGAMRFLSYFIKSFTKNFRYEIIEPVPAVRGHKQHIEQIIINLVQNACYALRESGEEIVCTLGAADGGKYAFIAVLDSGRGMSEAVRKKACEAFFTTRESGTGLGLSITADIVKEHGGKMNIESVEGKGTKVSIYIPASASGVGTPNGFPPPNSPLSL
jgi:signal transduction histidine kinase/ABC-type amino acid transport substrate-binding protein